MGRLEMVREALEKPELFLDDKQKRWLTPLNRSQAGLAQVGYCLNRLLVQAFFKLRVDGFSNIPAERPFVITPNHSSALDIPILAAALDQELLRHTFWAGAQAKAFRTLPQRWICRLAQVVPIDRGNGAGSSLAFASLVLRQGKNLIWFPEGMRSLTGKLQPLRPGIGLLLQSCDVPVVPVYLHGTYSAMAADEMCPRPQIISVLIGVSVDRQTLLKEGNGSDPVERIVDGLHGRLAALSLQDQCGKLARQ